MMDRPDPGDSEAPSGTTTSSFEVGEWRAEPTLNRLLRGEESVALEPKVMEVLQVLATNAGRLTSRADLLRRVWDDAYLGEDPTTRAISELRKAFGDSARDPRYIETIHKKGYRLIAPVRHAGPEGGAGVAKVGRPPLPRSWLVGAALAAVATAVLLLTPRERLDRESAPATLRRTTLTSFPGRETGPALSPDGSRVAFSWTGESGSDADIYLKQANTGPPVRLTRSPEPEWHPVWSPDGDQIAFVRLDIEGCGIFALPSIGGSATLLTRCESAWLGFDWSPGAEAIIVADRTAGGGPTPIWRIDLATGERRRLTDPPLPHQLDTSPRVSPDGRRIAFRRKLGEGQFEIFVMPIDGGEARRLTFERQDNGGLDWTPDGESLVFSSNRDGLFSLWRVTLSGEISPLGIEDAYLPSIAARADRLVYEKRSFDLDLWRVDLPRPGQGAEAALWSTSTQPELDPQFSPDGSRVAFVSMRSGSHELWVAMADGTEARQLTRFSEPAPGWSPAVQHPRWTRDGARIIFAARADGNFDVFSVRAAGGVPRPLTSHVADDVAPVWMEDERRLYFVSDRTGRWEIWRLEPEAGEPEQVTHSGVDPAIDRLDEETLLFQRDGALHRLSLGSGETEPLLEFGAVADWGLGDGGVYYLTEEGLGFFDPATGTSRDLPLPSGPPPAGGFAISRSGLAISPDGRTLIYTASNRAETDIVMVEGLF